MNPADLLFRDSGIARALTGPKLGTPPCIPNPCKIIRKMDAKIDAKQVMEKHEEVIENALRIDHKIYETCIYILHVTSAS